MEKYYLELRSWDHEGRLVFKEGDIFFNGQIDMGGYLTVEKIFGDISAIVLRKKDGFPMMIKLGGFVHAFGFDEGQLHTLQTDSIEKLKILAKNSNMESELHYLGEGDTISLKKLQDGAILKVKFIREGFIVLERENGTDFIVLDEEMIKGLNGVSIFFHYKADCKSRYYSDILPESKTKKLSFSEALVLLKEGKRLRFTGMEEKDFIMMSNNNNLGLDQYHFIPAVFHTKARPEICPLESLKMVTIMSDEWEIYKP